MSSTGLDSGDLARLADLHSVSLPDSLVSILGKHYAVSFYRYVDASEHEFAFVHRCGGTIVSACVLSLSPNTLEKRLALSTPLLLWAVARMFRLPLRELIRETMVANQRTYDAGDRRETGCPEESPEVILIFTSPDTRGHGFGGKLLGECEEFLRTRGYTHYVIKTEDSSANRALSFYARNGFVQRGRFRKHGTPYQVWTKQLGPA